MFTDPTTVHDYYDGGRLVRGTAPRAGVSFSDLGLSPCEGGHDYYNGECQTCGDLHPDDCLGCAPGSTAALDHEYDEPEECETHTATQNLDGSLTCVVCGETVGDDDEPSDTFEPDTVAEARGDK